MSTPRAQLFEPFDTTAARAKRATTLSTGLVGTLKLYLSLTKPRLLPMVLFTALPVMLMATAGRPHLSLILVTLLGTALAAASANTLNCFAERERDALMLRTRQRPLPAGLLSPRRALTFGIALGASAVVLLWLGTNGMAAAIALGGILFYLFVYTLWLKPRTPQSIVIGGAAGAVAPLIASAAINGHVDQAGLLLFLIIFFWQPPHFWAISLYRKDEYANAGFPMLPLVIGDDATRLIMLRYTLFLIPVTLAPVALGYLGNFYLALSLALGAWFSFTALQVIRRRTSTAARRMFRVSLVYLFLLFLGMIADRTLLS